MPESATVAQWEHDPTRKGHKDSHTPEGPCFGCWCYGCGQPTNGPRDPEKGNQSPNLPDPTSHRWCFE